MKRILMLIGIPFLATVFCLSYISPIFTGLFAAVGAIVNYLSYKNKTMLVIIIISIVFAFNIFSNYQVNELFDTEPFDKVQGNITAQVIDKGRTSTGKTTAYTLEILDSDIEGLPNGFNGILYADFNVFIDYYDVINVNMICNHITANESFDFSKYYQSIGIMMTFYSYATPTVIENTNDNFKYSLLYKAKILNDNLCAIFDREFATQYSGMLKAIILGNDDDLDDILYLNAGRAGVTHIFVVSGLHIALLVGVFIALLDLINVKQENVMKSSKYQNIFLIAITWGLVLITGFKISTVRAGIMVTAMLLGKFFSRKGDSLNSLFGAGVVIIALSPYTITSLSFQLSFSATLGIILLVAPFQDFFENLARGYLTLPESLPKMLKLFINSISVTLSATIGMLPVLIICFKGISLISLLANFIIVPLLPFILISGALLLCTSFIPFISEIMYAITLIFLFILKTLTNFFGGFKFAYLGLDFPILYWYLAAVAWICCIKLLFPYLDKKFLAKFIMGFTIIVFISAYVINYNVLTITIFSSYSANSIVINNRSTANIINLDNKNYNDTNIAKYIQSKNINKIDNYINFVESKIDYNDILYIQQVASITRMVNSIEYKANNKLSFDDVSMYFTEKHRFFSKNGSYLDIFYGDITFIMGEISGSTILITDLVEFAEFVEYDILFIDTDQEITPTKGKQVIYIRPNETTYQTLKLKL